MTLVFEAEAKTAGAGTMGQRWRVGAYYSNETSTAVTSYTKYMYTLNLTTTGGIVSLIQQLMIDSGTAYGKKVIADTSVIY